MRRRLAGAAAVLGALAAAVPLATATTRDNAYEPQLDPADFSTTIDNRYFPLPVGRVLVYHGAKNGEAVVDRVTVTNETKTVAEGITARVVRDVLRTTSGALREKTDDWYAQNKDGSVWYFGENTTAYNPDGSKDTSGSWEAGVHDAEPGVIMEADPQIPDAYRQEFARGNAEDTAWIVDRGGSITVPYEKLTDVLTSLEATRVEPGSYDLKVYAPGIGIVVERSLTENGHAKLVAVRG
jgi:hypothetical protein